MTKPKTKSKERGNAYWLPRLEREHPDFHARLLAGEFTSVRAACAAAGLKPLPTRLDALKREWTKASPAEHDEFLRWLGITSPVPATGRIPLPVSLVGPDGDLLDEVAERIKTIMKKLGLPRPGKSPAGHSSIMTAMGYSPCNPRLANALNHRGKPEQDFLDRLRKWIIEAED